MKRLAVIAVVFALGLLSHAQQPKEATQFDLLNQCQPLTRNPMNLTVDEMLGVRECLGYISGMRDMLTAWRAESKVMKQPDSAPMCVPYESTTGELVRVVVKYMNDNPTSLHEPRAGPVLHAFIHAYPCK